MMTLELALSKIRAFPNVPKEGIVFRDITPLLSDAEAFSIVLDEMVHRLDELNIKPTKIVSPEARGFIFGIALAERLKVGFIPVRKPGKLPGKTVEITYKLEYGEDCLQMHEDALSAQDQVILVDDVLATGGTILACQALLEQQGAKVNATVFLMDLVDLKGKEKLAPIPVISLISY